MADFPAARVRLIGGAPVDAAAGYVLYWMTAHRRLGWNASLERAVWWAREVGRPLLVFEPLDAGYPWASHRFHRFVLDGMADNAAGLAGRQGVTYFPYVEPEPGAGRGLLAALAARAAVVVTDDWPAFGYPRRIQAAGQRLRVRLEAVDGNGLLPLLSADRAFPTAYAFRRFLQRRLPAHLGQRPAPDPVADLPPLSAPALPPGIHERWPTPAEALMAGEAALASLPIDATVGPTRQRGGSSAARLALARFLAQGLAAYGQGRNQVEADLTSRLSPYLHFGHIGSWQVVAAVLDSEGWLGATASSATGARTGWWGVSPGAEAFLDQVVTWRELGFNMCALRPDDYDAYDSLPDWARATLGKHASDPRSYRYQLDELRRGATHDPLWNAAQGQLVQEGRIHNYLRMLWGKKVLEWTGSPREALAALVELNNRFALDGRDPNSYSGIFWTLGRYDRPWGPERPVFGTVRYMSSENTARKMSVREYVRRYAPQPGGAPDQPTIWT